MGKIFVGDISLIEKFSWMEANHENNKIKSTVKIFTYTVCEKPQGQNIFSFYFVRNCESFNINFSYRTQLVWHMALQI